MLACKGLCGCTGGGLRDIMPLLAEDAGSLFHGQEFAVIDMTLSAGPSPLLHTVPNDPGLAGPAWTKDREPVVEAPPDDAARGMPYPGARWARDVTRTGVGGVVSPRVVRLADGSYRLYYTQILAREGFAAGANDYDNASTRILSAKSDDGQTWTPEPGVRLSAEQGGAGEFRVASSEVVPVGDGRRLRMYFECCPGTQSISNSIKSALSDDGGITWSVEPGNRIADTGNYMAPRIVHLADGRVRLYCCKRDVGIVSAISKDGLAFEMEPGVRVAQDGKYDKVAAFACDILRMPNGAYVMYYAGYAAANRAYILRALSDDGLLWRKSAQPVVSPAGPGTGAWDAVKCSEVSLYRLPENAQGRRVCRMVYEACDGTSAGERGVWRIAGATEPG
jgi:hypothetical protein